MSKPIPTLQKYMTTTPHTINKDQPLAYAHKVMRDHKIRHLPVLDGDSLAGMVSIGDLLKALLVQRQREIEQLQQYITG